MIQRARKTQPLYVKIHDNLKDRIVAGEWVQGAMLPSENELCEFYNIARGTIRKILAALENEGYIRRERGRGTFIIFNTPVPTMSPTYQKIVSFIVPYVRDSFVSSMLLGLEREARANGYSVLFSHVENDIDKQEQIIRAAYQQRTAGIILYPVNSTNINPVLYDLVEQNYPLVLVDRYIRGVYLDYVTSDNFNGGIFATQHLLALGHKRVAFLTWNEMSTAMEHRRSGYRQALGEAGLSLDPDLEWVVEGYPVIDQDAIERHLSGPNPPTAVFAANDQLALVVERAARLLGIAIPNDLALVGFDDLDISAHLDIPLTTITQHSDEIGRTAWNILYRKIIGSQLGIERVVLPVQLIIRQSCGANIAAFSGNSSGS